jgi:hypothetical protein
MIGVKILSFQITHLWHKNIVLRLTHILEMQMQNITMIKEFRKINQQMLKLWCGL